jgi:cysteine desulfurase family protein (TIGR01976 family)
MPAEPTPFDPAAVRGRFPALRRTDDSGRPVVFADAPGGTQVPDAVIAAVSGYLATSNANTGGAFPTSEETDATIDGARAAAADLVGSTPDEIVFGPNMTTLAMSISRSISRRLGPGDEVVVTRLDHDANIAPWLLAARDGGAVVRWVDFDPRDGTLDIDYLAALLGSRTRVVAFTYASNALGTLTPVEAIVGLIRDRAPAALAVVDAVHAAQHRSIDVASIGADVLFCSPYKIFGPHLGVMWARPELIAGLRPYKVRPAPDHGPGRWETGTLPHENLAGFVSAVEYLAWLGRSFGEGPTGSVAEADRAPTSDRRRDVVAGLEAARCHEAALSRRFLEGAAGMDAIRLYGVSDTLRIDERTPTFALRVGDQHPAKTAAALAGDGVFAWDGDYYAMEVMQRLRLADGGGAVRVGFCHYNTIDEVDRVVASLADVAMRLDPA